MNKNDEFDPKELLQDVHATITQPAKFATIFCESARTQKDIDKVLKDILRELLHNDNEARTTMKSLIREVDNEDVKFLFKKIRGSVWTLCSVVFGGIGVFVIQYFSK